MPPRNALATSVALSYDAEELTRYALLQDYHRFIRHSWHVIEPGVKFTDGMPIAAVTDHVQALVEGSLGRQNLLINIPPRCMKSTSVSVALVPWVWAHPEWRHLKFLYSSYSGDLSNRDSDKTRLLIQSQWYQSTFPEGARLKSEAITRLKNTRGGHRIATSVGGKGTGEGGDFIICDDPHNALEAESETVRAGTVTWWRETMSTRGNDPKSVKRIVVMQRLNEADLSGHILAEEFEDYVHLCLPMRYEPQVYDYGKRPLVRFKDPRAAAYDPKKDGALLWPERFGEAETKRLERNLGTYGAAGQLQQRPAPRGGGLVKEDYIGLWPAQRELPTFEFVLQSYDTALTEATNKNPDPDDTAHVAFGVFTHRGRKQVMVLEAWDDKLRYPELRKRVLDNWRATYGGARDDPLRPGHRADIAIIENKGSGISLTQELVDSGVAIYPYNPGNADKMARLQRSLPLIEGRLLWLLESGKEPGKPALWVRKALKQWLTFPAGAHDDYVDCLTQALIYLHNQGWLDLEDDVNEVPVDEDYARRAKRRANPYAQ